MVANPTGAQANHMSPIRIGWLVLAVCLCATMVHAADSEPSPRDLQLAKTLLSSLTSERAAEPELVVRSLVERGETIVPALLVVGRELREVEHVQAIVPALRRLDQAALQKYLLEFVAKQEDGRATNAAWLHLAESCDASSVPAVLSTMDGNPYFLKRTAERGLTRLLVRNDRYETWSLLEKELAPLSEETRMRVALSIGETDSAFGLDLLAKLLGRWPGVDHSIVSAIAQMPEAGRGEVIASRLRPYLDSSNLELRRETITALAVFADVESAGTLIENLSDDRGGIRGNSHWALTKLSGLKFPDSPERWKIWHTDEVEWWEAEGVDFLEVLASGSELQILEALQTISVHRLYRMKFSPLLRKLLEHPSPDVRDAAEKTLVELGLMVGRKTQDAVTSLEAQGFTPITPEEYHRARSDSGRSGGESAKGSSRIVPIVAILVLLVLLGRIFGPAALVGIGKLWGSGEVARGPIVLKIGREKGEVRREETKV